MRRGRRLILPVLLLRRRRLAIANGRGAWRRDLLLRWGLGGLAGFLDDGGEGGGVDEAHEEEGLEDGVGELGGLFEELGRFGGVAHYETFHLREDVEELGDGEGGERLRDGVGAGEARGQIDAWWEGREAVCLGGWCCSICVVWEGSFLGWLLRGHGVVLAFAGLIVREVGAEFATFVLETVDVASGGVGSV